jgi:hypothetical protein
VPADAVTHKLSISSSSEARAQRWGASCNGQASRLHSSSRPGEPGVAGSQPGAESTAVSAAVSAAVRAAAAAATGAPADGPMPLEDTRETVCGASGAVAQEDTDAVDRGVTNAAPGDAPVATALSGVAENGCSSREPAEEPGGGLSPPASGGPAGKATWTRMRACPAGHRLWPQMRALDPLWVLPRAWGCEPRRHRRRRPEASRTPPRRGVFGRRPRRQRCCGRLQVSWGTACPHAWRCRGGGRLSLRHRGLQRGASDPRRAHEARPHPAAPL